jgi:hypothetical protein
MLPLNQAIEALRAAATASHVVRLSVELRCVLRVSENGQPEYFVLTEKDSATAQTCHTITVELNDVGASQETQQPSVTAAPYTTKGATTPHDLVRQLSNIFGEPGFDSAARASVFAEIVESLSALQAAGLIQSFRSDPAEVPVERPGDPAVARARTRITRLVKLGPGGLRGIPQLISILEEHGLDQVLKMIRDSWKTQEAWIDTAPPGVRID